MTTLEKLASLRMYDIPKADLETLFAEPMREAGYISSVHNTINENNWWPCCIGEVVEFLKYNE